MLHYATSPVYHHLTLFAHLRLSSPTILHCYMQPKGRNPLKEEGTQEESKEKFPTHQLGMVQGMLNHEQVHLVPSKVCAPHSTLHHLEMPPRYLVGPR